MIISALSESEVEKIKTLFESEGIKFEILVDNNLLNSNKESMSNNMRHLSSPSISTHILSIKVADDALSNISPELNLKLLELGIAAQGPSEEDFKDNKETKPLISKTTDNKKTHKKVFVSQLILIAGAVVIYLIIKNFIS